MILEQLEILIRNIVSENAFPVLAKVDRLDTKNYVCDCIELNNTGEETNTIYARVAIPKLWGTAQGGIWMSPSKGAVVLLNFLNGDRNYPVIAAVMGSSVKETAPEDTLLIKIGQTELRIADKITIQVGGESLGEILKNMAAKASEIQTYGSPTTQKLMPEQKLWWEHLKNTVLPKIFK